MNGDNGSLAALQRQPLFRGLPEDALAQVLASGITRTLPANHILFLEGDYESSLFVVLSGQVKLCVHALDEREIVLGISGPGQLFGEIALLDEGPRTATAVTVRETELLQFERAGLLALLQAHPGAMMQVVTLLCNRLRAANQMLEEIVFHDAQTRLARALKRLSDEHGRPEGEARRLPFRPGEGILEAHAGLQMETVGRLLRAWEGEGWLGLEDEGLVVRDRSALDRLAGRVPRDVPKPRATAPLPVGRWQRGDGPGLDAR